MKFDKDSIIKLPNQNLRKISKRVGIINDDTKQLIENMISSVVDWDNSRDHEVTVALAAIQIDQLLRVVIIREDFDHESPATYTSLINPEIIKYEGELETDYEGCLSIQSVYGLVPRYSKVRIEALDVNGTKIKMKASGFLSRVLQHEIDHTNGKLFIDHIENSPDAFYKLTKSGKLEQLDYDKEIKNNKQLWP